MHYIKLSWMYSSGKKLLWEQNVQFFKQFSPCVIKFASKPRIVNLSFRHHLSLKFCTASYKFFRNLAEKNLSRFSFIFCSFSPGKFSCACAIPEGWLWELVRQSPGLEAPEHAKPTAALVLSVVY